MHFTQYNLKNTKKLFYSKINKKFALIHKISNDLNIKSTSLYFQKASRKSDTQSLFKF